MANELQQIRTHLEGNQLNRAVQDTLEWFSGSEPLALASTLGGALKPLIEAGRSELVQAYLKGLQSFIEPEVLGAIRKSIDDSQSGMSNWGGKLALVTQERLQRECRDAIRIKSYDLALIRARQILAFQVGDQSLENRCQILGSVLGSLETMADQVETLWKRIAEKWPEWKMPDELRTVVLNARKARLDSIYQRRYETGETEWIRQVTDLSSALKTELPRPNTLGEPEQADIDKFVAAAEGLIKAGVASPNGIGMPDVLWILVEYTERVQTATASQAGVEQRVHSTLGPRARKVVEAAFFRLAESEPLRKGVLDVGLKPPLDRYLDLALDLMAAIGRPEFADFALGVVRDKRRVPHHSAAVKAIGACGGESSLQTLTELFRGVTKGRVVDGHDRRVAIRILDAMSRVVRRHNIFGPQRDALLDTLIKSVSADDTRLRLGIASRLCQQEPALLNPAHLEWAIQRFMEGLARPDQTPMSHRPTDAEEVRKRPFGQRQGLINLLIRIGEPALSIIHNAIISEDRVTGAHVAVAEILGKIGHRSSVGPLDRMLRSILLTTDEELKGFYEKEHEQVFDPELGRMIPLDRSSLIGAVCEALDKIESPESIDILHRFRDQVKAGRIQGIGKRTAAVLSHLPDERPKTHPTADTAETLDPISEGGLFTPPSQQEGPSTAELVADLRSGGLFGREKIRTKKVSALAQLAQRLATDALEPMMESLADKDALVRSSAKTALLTFSAPSTPPAIQKHFADFVFAELTGPKSKLQEGLADIVLQVTTTEEPWASHINRIMRSNPTGHLRALMARLSRLGGGAYDVVEPIAPAETSSEEKSEPAEKKEGSGDKFAMIEQKRIYLNARREWVKGGKQGPPPQPPPGVSA